MRNPLRGCSPSRRFQCKMSYRDRESSSRRSRSPPRRRSRSRSRSSDDRREERFHRSHREESYDERSKRRKLDNDNRYDDRERSREIERRLSSSRDHRERLGEEHDRSREEFAARKEKVPHAAATPQFSQCAFPGKIFMLCQCLHCPQNFSVQN